MTFLFIYLFTLRTKHSVRVCNSSAHITGWDITWRYIQTYIQKCTDVHTAIWSQSLSYGCDHHKQFKYIYGINYDVIVYSGNRIQAIAAIWLTYWAKGPAIYKCVRGRVDFGVMKYSGAIWRAMKSFSHLQWVTGRFEAMRFFGPRNEAMKFFGLTLGSAKSFGCSKNGRSPSRGTLVDVPFRRNLGKEKKRVIIQFFFI